jgi:hypothetical protein
MNKEISSLFFLKKKEEGGRKEKDKEMLIHEKGRAAAFRTKSHFSGASWGPRPTSATHTLPYCY